jgi:hypothetical protein
MIRSFQTLLCEMAHDSCEREAAAKELHPLIPEFEMERVRLAKGDGYVKSLEVSASVAVRHSAEADAAEARFAKQREAEKAERKRRFGDHWTGN